MRFLDGTIQCLDLSNNSIRGTLPSSIFTRLPNLVELRVEGGKIDGGLDVDLLSHLVFHPGVHVSIGHCDPGFELPREIERIVPPGCGGLGGGENEGSRRGGYRIASLRSFSPPASSSLL